MKKIFLFAIIVAGAATTFAQSATTPKTSLAKQGQAQSQVRPAAAHKDAAVKTAPVNAKATNVSATTAPAKSK